MGGLTGAMTYAAPFFLAPNNDDLGPIIIKTDYLSAIDTAQDALACLKGQNPNFEFDTFI